MRRCCALLAGLLAGRAACVGDAPADAAPADAAPADDVRDTFGLGKQAQAAAPSCGDGRAFSCAIASDPLDDATPYALSTWLPAGTLARLPVADATHDAVAAYALGASLDEAGPVFGGASGLEDRWTIDGAPADNLRTGAVDTRVPIAFLDGILVRAGGFSARDRASTGGTIDARLVRGTPDHELSADVWTQVALAARDLPHATGSYDVRRLTTGTGPATTASLVATGPLAAPGALAGATTWYAAGIAPRVAISDYAWRAAREVDGDGDGVPDGLPGDPVVALIEHTTARTVDYFVPVMARVGADRGPQHLELSLVGDVERGSRFLANATLPAAGVDRSTLVGDAIATWRAAWDTTRLRAQLTWHRSVRRDTAHDDAAARIPQLQSGYVPASLAEDPRLAAACDDSAQDPAPRIASCPVAGLFASGGAGALTSAIGDRPTATLDASHRLGDHVVRAGATFEDTRLVTTTSYTADELQLSVSPIDLTHRRFFLGSCGPQPGDPCGYASSSQLTYRTVYAAAYAEDTVSPVPGLTIDGGLRWELMWVGRALQFSHELAPRVGVTWDALGGGRSRLWASYGRTFALLPAGLGQTVIQRDATVDDIELFGQRARSVDPGAAFRVAPDVQPIEQDEVTLGAELALVGALRATLWGQGRWLRHGLETTAAGFDNPGAGGDIAATRESEVIAFQIEMVQQGKLAIRAGVTWGRAVGTWTGPYDPRQGANLLQGPAWDSNASNLSGPLPTDPGGRVFVEAERRDRLGAVDLAVSTRLAVSSGRPRNALANGVDGVVELLPRGALGRGPPLAQANLHLAAGWRGFTATLDVLNVFDRRDASNLDELYTTGSVRPIEGGSAGDLVLLTTTDGKPAQRRATFQLPTAFQPPLSIALGVHKAF